MSAATEPPASSSSAMAVFVGMANSIADPLGVSPQAVTSTGAYVTRGSPSPFPPSFVAAIALELSVIHLRCMFLEQSLFLGTYVMETRARSSCGGKEAHGCMGSPENGEMASFSSLYSWVDLDHTLLEHTAHSTPLQLCICSNQALSG